MSTSTTPSAAALGYSSGRDDSLLPGDALQRGAVAQGPIYYGLALATWIKIGVIAVLMLALYRFNLSRLWAKTNPINGEGNWEHAFLIPFIGIYYLYVWREDLLKPKAALEPAAERWSLPGIWALLHIVPVILLLVGLLAFFPGLLSAAFSFNVQGLRAELARLPVGWILIALFLFSVGAAVYAWRKGDHWKFRVVQQWLANVWRGLGVWMIGVTVVLGLSFFAMVASPPAIEPVLPALRLTVAAAILGGAAAIAWFGSFPDARERYDRFLAGSATWFGGYIMVFGILFSLWGVYPGQNDFFKDIGMVISLFGVVLLVGGWHVMRIAWFPIVLLFCALPWPDQVYSQVAMPLQNLAAKIGVFVLQATGVDAGQNGTKIWMKDAKGAVQVLDVAVACAGLKSLMTFVTIAAAIAFLSGRMLWQKLFIVASAVPIAIFCNTMRICGQGLLHRYVSREWSEGFAHGFTGLIMLIPGFFLILAVCWVIDHLFIEEADDVKPATIKAARPAATAAIAGQATPALAGVATASAAPATLMTPTPAAAAPSAAAVIRIPKRPATAAAPAAPAPAASGPAPAAAPVTASTPATVPAAAAKPVAPAVRAAPAPATKPAAAGAVRPPVAAPTGGTVKPAVPPAGAAPAKKPAAPAAAQPNRAAPSAPAASSVPRPAAPPPQKKPAPAPAPATTPTQEAKP